MSAATIRQQRLHYLEEFAARERDDSTRSAFNVAARFTFDAPIDPVQLRAALNVVVAQHEILRSTFAAGPSGLVRSMVAPFEVGLESTDEESACEGAGRRFDLADGPLFRFYEVRSEQLIVVFHRAIADEHTFDTFERSLVAALANESLDAPSADSVEAWREAQITDQSYRFWAGRLAAPLPALDLPTDRARPDVAASTSIRIGHEVDAATADALAGLGLASQTNEENILLAALFTFLRRMTDQDDLIVGCVTPPELPINLSGALGSFGNTLPIRIGFAEPGTFDALANQVQRCAAEARAHAAVPFEELLQKVEVPRDSSRSPVFQAAFRWEDIRSQRAQGSIGACEALDLGAIEGDLRLSAVRHHQGVRLHWDAAAALFEKATLARFAARFAVLLRSIVDRPAEQIARLSMLPDDERETLLVRWNDTRRAIPESLYAHELFRSQAARAPDRLALIFGRTTLTYGELDHAANRLSRHISARGSVAGGLIGVFLERGVEMITALHAILRTGAAYVPIDPEYPPDRIALMVEDSRLTLVLTRSELKSALPEGTALVLMDAEQAAINAQSTEPLPSRAGDGDERCYVIYTSGSTGKPKGVEVPHRAFVNFLHSMSRAPGIVGDDVLVAVTTLSFDIAGLELFLPLCVGASIVIATREEAADGAALAALLRNSNASIMQATPATWRLLVGANFDSQRPLKVLCGGEAFPADLARELTERFAEVHNMYGPTETTVWSTTQRLLPDEPISIGHPIDNTSIYILDREGTPTPIGVPGELVIGGLGVALGYLDRAELTRERFVPDPFSTQPGARMYRTGDLALRRPDGAIVYQRRLDHQVKVRGYRIELGEIEFVLAAHTNVRSAVVIVREDRPGDARLCAYFVPGDDVPTVTELRKHLKKRLPDFMIPQHFFELANLPLTPAGKVDRKALPAPALSIAPRNDRPPNTKEEKWLAAVWTQALGIETVSASDHFFDIGGHSLLSMTVIARVERDAGHRFRPRDLLHASLAELARDLEGKVPESGDPTRSAPQQTEPRSPAPRAPSTPPTFLTKLRSRFFGK